jgi:hypothetical protein
LCFVVCCPDSGEIETVWIFDNDFRDAAHGIACTPSGVLLVTRGSLYAIDPVLRRCERVVCSLDGTEKESNVVVVAVAPTELCAYVSDCRDECIRRITLPPKWFVARNHGTKK